MALEQIYQTAIEHIREMATSHLERASLDKFLSRLSEVEEMSYLSEPRGLILHYLVALLVNPFENPTRDFSKGSPEWAIKENILHISFKDKDCPLRLFAEAYFLCVIREGDNLDALLSHFDECPYISESEPLPGAVWVRIAYAMWKEYGFEGDIQIATEILLELYRRGEHAWASRKLLRYIAEATAYAGRDRLEEITSDVRDRQEEGRSEEWIRLYLGKRCRENIHPLRAERLATAMEEALASDPSLSCEDVGRITWEMSEMGISFEEAQRQCTLFQHLRSAINMTGWNNDAAEAFALFAVREWSLSKGFAFAVEFSDTMEKFPEEASGRIWNRIKLNRKGVPEEDQGNILDRFEILFHEGVPTFLAWRQACEAFGVSAE